MLAKRLPQKITAMGNKNTSLDDVKKNIQGWADSEILDDKKKENISGGKNSTKPGWGSFCGGSTPQ